MLTTENKQPFVIPPPPDAPQLLRPDTKYTTRLYGSNPFDVAVSVTQHIYTAALPPDSPGIDDNVGDRPWGIVLVTPDDPVEAISATPLIHFPNDAPILFTEADHLPTVTRQEIQRLGPTGIDRAGGIHVIVVGRAATPPVLRELQNMGLRTHAITAPDPFELANRVDQYYGQIQNPDLGVPTMGNSGSTEGSGMMDVFIGSADDYAFALPVTHWVSHMPGGFFWVTRDNIPEPTIDALKRRMQHANIYLFGGPDQISPHVVRELSRFGMIGRVTNDDPVAFNKPPTDTAIDTCIAFAKMWDPAGGVGWNITTPGHGFTLIRQDAWTSAVGSAILSHLGFHAPLLMTDHAGKLPDSVEAYLKMVAPTFQVSPAQGPYNMTYVIGDYQNIAWKLQAHVDFLSVMANRRVVIQNTGSLYSSNFG